VGGAYAVQIVYESTPKSDNGLRDVVVDVTVARIYGNLPMISLFLPAWARGKGQILTVEIINQSQTPDKEQRDRKQYLPNLPYIHSSRQVFI
jgi:hypothetical protein